MYVELLEEVNELLFDFDVQLPDLALSLLGARFETGQTVFELL
jgi:hypothetical protein